MPLRDGDESPEVRQVCCRRGEVGDGERKPAEAVQARRRPLRRPIDLRPARLRYLLPDDHARHREVLYQAERQQMHGAEGRRSLRAARRELLRCLQRW